MESICQATTFTLFPKLPPEIRLKIWRYITPGPRIVEIQYATEPKRLVESIPGTLRPVGPGWISKDPQPIVLHICQESRMEALKRYQLALGTYENLIYVDFSVDILYFARGVEGNSFINYRMATCNISDHVLDIWNLRESLDAGGFDAGYLGNIQYLIIEIKELLAGHREYLRWNELRYFKGLKELTVISRDIDKEVDELITLYNSKMVAVVEKNSGSVVPRITIWKAKEDPTPMDLESISQRAKSPAKIDEQLG